MPYTRKEFLKTASLGLALTAITGKLLASNSSSALDNPGKSKDFGLQLWTIKDAMHKDPQGTLKQVAAMGYKQIESFEGNMGIFWGMKNTELKNLLDGLGMKIISSHCNIDKDFDKKAAEAAEIGIKYLIDPWYGPQKNIDLFKKEADKFNERGATCKRAGLRFGYHNHDYPFIPIDGQLPMDVMIQYSNPNLVDFEMDIYWVVTAGQDPEKWFEKYPNRFRLCHIKDRKKDISLAYKDASCIVGKGEIDYPKILKAAKRKGMEYYIIEQEHFDGITTMEAAKANADYMKELKI
ncbi:MAG: sugar phosphate isomerase/epimerase [Ginsengibacter sp.]